ncbi:MAG: tripartite tricarboxylate transporter substrate-binding protein, partial [Xanthomonadales bacterium]|nr:tripartite tricarboxylate transporter substrate-binding protein [Xanthomonadales bacterium]
MPTRPGGGYDAYSRLLQPFLERALSARIVIENRPEAGGIVGALAIRDAAPDGRTLGIINASGLLAARAGDAGRAPDPASDFTVLASIVSNHVVLFSGRDSGIADVASLLRVAQTRPIVAGVRDAGSSSFYALPIAAALLGFDYELVTGYVGSASRTLAVMRGEVDIVVATFDSVQGPVRDGELVPLDRCADGRCGKRRSRHSGRAAPGRAGRPGPPAGRGHRPFPGAGRGGGRRAGRAGGRRPPGGGSARAS